MPRRRLMVANWKMYKTGAEASAYVTALGARLGNAAGAAEIVVAPAFPALAAAVEAARGLPMAISGQNLHWAAEGAYTGEVSAGMLAAVGCRYVIVGHSERRQMFGDTDEVVRKKVAAALGGRLTPIVCVGETREQRRAGETEAVLKRQCEAALSGSGASGQNCVVAYEPVWAIGTGDTASPEMAQAAHHWIRQCVAAAIGAEAAVAMPILDGGSVKLDNVTELLRQPDLDGALVGGASLDATVFAQLAQRAV